VALDQLEKCVLDTTNCTVIDLEVSLPVPNKICELIVSTFECNEQTNSLNIAFLTIYYDIASTKDNRLQ